MTEPRSLFLVVHTPCASTSPSLLLIVHVRCGCGWRQAGLVIIILKMGCCHDKENTLEMDLVSVANTNKAILSPTDEPSPTKNKRLSNAPTQTEKEEQRSAEQEGLSAEQELRQSPILGENGHQLWEELADDNEELEGDMLRATHTNNIPLSVEELHRRREIAATQPNFAPLEPRILPQLQRQANSHPLPKVTFGVLSTIKEEESSLNDTNRKSVNPISLSGGSRMADMRQLF